MSSNNDYIVYMHVNKINNKKYIGITRQIPEKRWAKGLGYRTQPFYKAIQKYGWDNFEHVILFKKLNYKQACIYEKQLISKHNTTDFNLGYNCSDGGEDVITYYNHLVHNNKTVYQYSFKGEYITSFNSVVEAAKSLNLKKRYATSNISISARNHKKSAYGFIWSYDYLGNNIEPYDLKFAYIGNHRQVYKYNLNGDYMCEYYSILDAAKELNVKSQSITAAIDKENRTCKGFQWRSFKNENGIQKYKNPKKDKHPACKKVIRISKNGEECIFDSIKEASIQTTGKEKSTGINRTLAGGQKTAYGYKWKYA